jgi:flagellar biosynthetic protein FliQ
LGADQSLELMRSLLWHTMLIAGPVLLAALVTGLVVSILQVATQLQEMTLSYIPKLLATALVLMALGPWMIHQMTQFAVDAMRLIPTLT